MKMVNIQIPRSFAILNLTFLLFITVSFSNAANANSTNSAQYLSGNTQLAYFIGFHSYPGNYYWRGSIYYKNAYWTKWRYIGYGCQKSCLIDRSSGRVIRCAKRCF
ncbi:TPA: hypothetical protein JBA38_02480 [Legionella pneumophila]|nr:hypothetical protein [Legionella pneumophila]HAT8831057.1 hypothetical protein [Legionella pneumophila subsp. pneumophila]HAT8309440.1 hypothetical protein [Legionella pneumophila]HAT8728596.1 hypothetical protein [Legionella pneumophila]HAT8750546.1 hypothetical protein [Legionella pneumophila]